MEIDEAELLLLKRIANAVFKEWGIPGTVLPYPDANPSGDAEDVAEPAYELADYFTERESRPLLRDMTNAQALAMMESHRLR